MKKGIIYIFLGVLLCGLLVSCQIEKEEARPRPHMYPRIQLPDRSLKKMSVSQCPFEAVIQEYASIRFGSEEAGEKPPHACWFDIVFESLGATVHCSYYDIDADRSYTSLVDDAYTMVSKHNVKANYRDELELENQFGAQGILFDIQGPVASPYQFFLSDKEKHFLRGSLYFNTKVERDSVAPIIDFLRTDLEGFLASVRFE